MDKEISNVYQKSTSMSEKRKWVDWFLDQPMFSIFVRIDDDFIMNPFNFYGLKLNFKFFNEAYDCLKKGNYGPHDDKQIEHEAEVLYGLLHARYLLTRPGLQGIFEKFQMGYFQTCPRVNCKACTCLPYGISEKPSEHKLKMYCPSCSDVYLCTEGSDYENLDGAYFGPSWLLMFLQKYSDKIRKLIPEKQPKVYVPKIFGFRLCHESDKEMYSSEDEDEDTSD